MKITEDEVKRNSEKITRILNSGNHCELKIEKGQVAVIEIRRRLK